MFDTILLTLYRIKCDHYLRLAKHFERKLRRRRKRNTQKWFRKWNECLRMYYRLSIYLDRIETEGRVQV